MKVVDSQGTRTIRAHKLYNNQSCSIYNVNVGQRKLQCGTTGLAIKRRAGLVVVGHYPCVLSYAGFVCLSMKNGVMLLYRW